MGTRTHCTQCEKRGNAAWCHRLSFDGARRANRRALLFAVIAPEAVIGHFLHLAAEDTVELTNIDLCSEPSAKLATYAHVCRRFIEANNIEAWPETSAKLESEVRRAGEIIRHLRDFLSRSEPRWSLVDLIEVTRKVVAALADVASSLGVTVQIDARPLAPIAGDRTQLEQVLVNLVRNAIEAVGEAAGREKSVWIRLRQVEGEIELAVEDNGRGIPAELAERLFKPFETNKPRGMGLGLSLSREIVQAHGGRLWRDATVTTGARFVLRSPCDRIDSP
jgi:two-component system, LuxR family, sensor kinase FixL